MRIAESRTSPLPGTARGRALASLAYTVVDLYCALRSAGERLAAPDGQSSARFAVLYVLAVKGPHTVAEIARDRGVARQGVQRLADELAADGLTEFVANPAHRRSMRLQLTAPGRAVTARILSRQARVFDAAATGLDAGAARSAETFLKDLLARVRAHRMGRQ